MNYNYVKQTIGNSVKWFKIVSFGSKYNKEANRLTMQPMQKTVYQGVTYWLPMVNAYTEMLVYGKYKGFTCNITDEEIWEVMGCKTIAQKQARVSEFNAHRNYFDTEGCDRVGWHKPTEPCWSNIVWELCETME